MADHNVKITASADTAQAEQKLNYLKELMGQLGREAAGKLTGMFAAAAVAKMAFDKVSEAINKNISQAKQINTMAIRFNVDPSMMHSITMAANDAGVATRALMMSMKQLGKQAEKAMSNKDMAENFKQLGFEATKLSEVQAKPIKFLPEISKNLMQIADENERAAAGALLFGRGYQQVLPLIETLGTNEEARERFLENQNAMTEEQIKQFKEIKTIQTQMEEGFNKMVAAAAPLIGWAVNLVNHLLNGLNYIKGMVSESEKAKRMEFTQSKSKLGFSLTGYADGLKARMESNSLVGDINNTLFESQTGKYNEALAVARSGGYNIRAGKPGDFQKFLAGGNGYDAFMGDILQKLIDAKKKQLESEQVGGSAGAGMEAKAKVMLSELPPQIAKAFTSEKGFEAFKEMSLKDVEQFDAEFRTKRINKGNIKRQDEAFEAQTAAEKEKLTKGTAYMKGLAAMYGLVWDEKTQRGYNATEYKHLLEARGEKETEENSYEAKIRTFSEAGAKAKFAKTVSATSEKEMRSLLSMREEDMTPLEKAQHAVIKAKAVTEIERKNAEKEKGYLDTAGTALETANQKQDSYDEAIARVEVLKAAAKKASDAREAFKNQRFSESTPAEVRIAYAKQVKDADAAATMALQDQLALVDTLGKQLVTLDAVRNAYTTAQAKSVEASNQHRSAIMQEQQAIEALREAKNRDFMKTYKEQQDLNKIENNVYEARQARALKIMKLSGGSRGEILDKQLEYQKDEYEDLAREYYKTYKKFKSNPLGQKGDMSDEQKSALEALSNKLTASGDKFLELTLEAAGGADKGRVSSMRRIGGGGLEFGGVKGTLEKQLEVAKAQLTELREFNKGNRLRDPNNTTGYYTLSSDTP